MAAETARALTSRAPAKINLSLHIVGRRQDGYHELESLVCFAGAADILRFTPADDLSLTLEGPTASLAGPDHDNLVLRAARLLSERNPCRTGAFHLIKRLPVAAGIGGGSSDAAAALRLLARANAISLEHPSVLDAARRTGSDVPVCIGARARMMRGVGDILEAPLVLPPLFAVLINPGVAVETPPVFRKLGYERGETRPQNVHPPVPEGLSFDALIDVLTQTRNDMQAAAKELAPVIADVIEQLRSAPDCKLARMSGSGATCFGLFRTCHEAAQAARSIRARRPGWWIKATMLR